MMTPKQYRAEVQAVPDAHEKKSLQAEMADHIRLFVETARHVDRTDFTGRDHCQLVRNYEEIFADLLVKLGRAV